MDNLKHLISAYFYELWDEHEYSSWQEAVDDFVRRSPERARSVPHEITYLLTDVRGDEELAKQLEQWGFDAQTPNGERAWLLGVRDRIASDLAAESA
ncbi:contact-dependent growth inhibition system immunity protein [Nocardioides terrigena]|uniref:contact-dependent growth inhibition system immunity protein n=1 Tax=Nocardioides terrigena TaxID=424797 RepID=UPI000D3209D5|nr:contact-dependent growth inhibition system immunity protein [Nocardioides terrigena]